MSQKWHNIQPQSTPRQRSLFQQIECNQTKSQVPPVCSATESQYNSTESINVMTLVIIFLIGI